MKKLIYTIFCMFLCNFLYADDVGNLVRDVQGAPTAVFRCSASNPILWFNEAEMRWECVSEASIATPLVVEEADGSPSISDVIELRFDSADGFVVSTPGVGVARVDLDAPVAFTNAANIFTQPQTIDNGANLNLDDQGELRFFELDANGSNFKAFKAPASITADTTCTLENDADFVPDSCVGNGVDDVGYDEILDEASGLTKRAKVNFTGTGIQCVDNGGSSRTDCTVNPILTTPCDMTYDTCFFDDFNSSADDASLGSITAANVGQWHAEFAATGANVNTLRGGISDGTVVPFSTSHARFRSAASGTAGGRAALWLAGPGALGPTNSFDANARGKTSIYFAMRTPATLSTAGDHYYLNIGANDVFSTTCAGSGCSSAKEAMLTYSNDQNSGKWLGSTRSAGTSTCDTGVTVAADTIYKACIVFNDDASQVDFYVTTTLTALDCRDPNNITGSPQCSITTAANIPGGSGGATGSGLVMYINLYKNAGSNQKFFYVDYFGFMQHSDTAR